jgi:hypothetical protein
LTLIRERALRYRVPFMLIVLAMPHGPYRETSEAELAWQVFHALAFGARGISYFAYWTPVNVAQAEKMQFRYGLIEAGRATASYFSAQRLNLEVRAIADALARYHSVAVADALGEVAAPLPIGPLAHIEGGAVTAGFFADGEDSVAVLLVNRDYRYATDVTLGLRAPRTRPELFDAHGGRWGPLPSTTLRLPPGRGRLLRWRQ